MRGWPGLPTHLEARPGKDYLPVHMAPRSIQFLESVGLRASGVCGRLAGSCSQILEAVMVTCRVGIPNVASFLLTASQGERFLQDGSHCLQGYNHTPPITFVVFYWLEASHRKGQGFNNGMNTRKQGSWTQGTLKFYPPPPPGPPSFFSFLTLLLHFPILV